MISWGGYWRYIRSTRDWHIFIRRAKCRPCDTTHALLPAFLLTRHSYPVAVMGAALVRAQKGEGTGKIGRYLGVPRSTVRGWRKRYRARAPMLCAGFSSVAVEWGQEVPPLSSDPYTQALEALGAAFHAVKRRLGDGVLPLWRFASAMTGGSLLAAGTTPLWCSLAGRYFMVPYPCEKEP